MCRHMGDYENPSAQCQPHCPPQPLHSSTNMGQPPTPAGLGYSSCFSQQCIDPDLQDNRAFSPSDPTLLGASREPHNLPLTSMSSPDALLPPHPRNDYNVLGYAPNCTTSPTTPPISAVVASAVTPTALYMTLDPHHGRFPNSPSSVDDIMMPVTPRDDGQTAHCMHLSLPTPFMRVATVASQVHACGGCSDDARQDDGLPDLEGSHSYVHGNNADSSGMASRGAPLYCEPQGKGLDHTYGENGGYMDGLSGGLSILPPAVSTEINIMRLDEPDGGGSGIGHGGNANFNTAPNGDPLMGHLTSNAHSSYGSFGHDNGNSVSGDPLYEAADTNNLSGPNPLLGNPYSPGQHDYCTSEPHKQYRPFITYQNEQYTYSDEPDPAGMLSNTLETTPLTSIPQPGPVVGYSSGGASFETDGEYEDDDEYNSGNSNNLYRSDLPPLVSASDQSMSRRGATAFHGQSSKASQTSSANNTSRTRNKSKNSSKNETFNKRNAVLPGSEAARFSQVCGKTSAAEKTRCDTCNINFDAADELEKHDKKEHYRPYVCLFHWAGCGSVFGSKNEWKRHVMAQHYLQSYWCCKNDKCCQMRKNYFCGPNGGAARAAAASGSSTDSAISAVPTSSPFTAFPSAEQGNMAVFNRKDLFTEHLRRMHKPKDVLEVEQRDKKLQMERALKHGGTDASNAKKRTKSIKNGSAPKKCRLSKALNMKLGCKGYEAEGIANAGLHGDTGGNDHDINIMQEWKKTLGSLQKESQVTRYAMPEEVDCSQCGKIFQGEDAWSSHLEHVASHMKKWYDEHHELWHYDGETNKRLLDWAMDPKVHIIQEVNSDSSGDRKWTTVNPLQEVLMQMAKETIRVEMGRK